MNARLTAVFATCLLLLVGCATKPQLPVPLASRTFAAPSNRIGVVMTKLPVVDTQFPGAGCLLCMAAASVANNELTTYTKTLPLEDLVQVNRMVSDVLKKKGATVTMIDTLDLAALPDSSNKEPNFARKDFSALKARHNIDKLLVIAINMVGVERNYAAYIPTGDPKAKVAGQAYIVNLNDNALEWFMPIDVVKSSDAKWDEPPKFPGLTNAYFQVLELAKDSIVTPLAN